jgi:anti-sigma regulatory factor (Ser/Thr protein kinase)
LAVNNKHSEPNRHPAKRSSAEGNAATLTSPASTQASREILTLNVRCGSNAPAVVRTALNQLSDLDPARDEVILVASELVTNAVVHSGGTPRDTIHVRAALDHDHVTISVHDPGLSADSPQVHSSDGFQAHGWGLQIVTELADRWGFEHDHGYRVWAELPLPSAATSPTHTAYN